MVLFFSLIVIAATISFVAYPLVSRSGKEALVEDEPENELQIKKASTYSAIKELEFDYALGNLSPSDHQDLEEKYKEKAIGILKDMDNLSSRASAKKMGNRHNAKVDDIEEEILAVRGRGSLELEDEIRAARGKGEVQISCPSCKQKVSGKAKFCSSCGASLSLTCPSCGKPAQKNDKFCAECGAKIA